MGSEETLSNSLRTCILPSVPLFLHPYNEYRVLFIEVCSAQWRQEKGFSAFDKSFEKSNKMSFFWVLIIPIKKDGILKQNQI